MIGLFFLAIVALWLMACTWLSLRLSKVVTTHKRWRVLATFAILLVLLSIPFVDEAIGQYQFEALCQANGIQSANVDRARGKQVKGQYGERKPLKGTILRISESDVRYLDAQGGNVLIQHKDYHSGGGWLMRYTWFGMSLSGPMLFNGNGCGFVLRDRIFKAAQISEVN